MKSVLCRNLGCIAIIAVLFSGCSSEPKLSHISGKVSFKGKPVPAGYVTFTPDVGKGTNGQVVGFQIKDGNYDSIRNTPPGIAPGSYKLSIAGFDGVVIPFFGQGKQIFNPINDECVVSEGVSTKDIEVPNSAGENVKIEKTADS